MRVTFSDLFDDGAQPYGRLHSSKAICVIFIQETRLTKVLTHGRFSPKDSRHSLTNEKHNFHVRVVGHPMEKVLQSVQCAGSGSEMMNEIWTYPLVSISSITSVNSSFSHDF